MGTLKEETMFDDDESLIHIVPIGIRRCPKCQGALAAFAFLDSCEMLIAMRELQKDLEVPIFAFMNKDEALKRARIVVFADTTEEFFLTPKEFGELAWRYLDHHVCARWN
jgi:hypothetical protein